MYYRISILLVILTFSFTLAIVFQRFWIAKMKALEIKQVTKLYGPSWHEKTKRGTPTMGGVIFVPVLLASLLAGSLINRHIELSRAALIISYPLMAAAVGLLDDLMKYKKRASDGMTSIQKLLLQIAITVFWVVFIAPPNYALLSPINRLYELSPAYISVALLTFVGVGLQNAVNVTDGLDGLATGCAMISFSVAVLLVKNDTTMTAALLSSVGICLAFLWHNCNPASVFMGDVGAHFIAGMLFTWAVLSTSFVAIIPVCFIFGVEIVSVAVQIAAIRLFGKKVFLMSPVHHHFEMRGWSETQIVTRFWIIHIIGMAVTGAIIYMLTLE